MPAPKASHPQQQTPTSHPIDRHTNINSVLMHKTRPPPLITAHRFHSDHAPLPSQPPVTPTFPQPDKCAERTMHFSFSPFPTLPSKHSLPFSSPLSGLRRSAQNRSLTSCSLSTYPTSSSSISWSQPSSCGGDIADKSKEGPFPRKTEMKQTQDPCLFIPGMSRSSGQDV